MLSRPATRGAHSSTLTRIPLSPGFNFYAPLHDYEKAWWLLDFLAL